MKEFFAPQISGSRFIFLYFFKITEYFLITGGRYPSCWNARCKTCSIQTGSKHKIRWWGPDRWNKINVEITVKPFCISAQVSLAFSQEQHSLRWHCTFL